MGNREGERYERQRRRGGEIWETERERNMGDREQEIYGRRERGERGESEYEVVE